MSQMIEYRKSYQEYKEELTTELTKTAEGFVRIGYLLKVARDTDILAQSPYQTVVEFAKAEYGIDKTMVSRFMSINDRFSEGGYSDQLQEQWRGYGYAKLTLMLQLPDEVNQEISPAFSKAEIQAVKDEVDAEAKITDIEVLMEPKQERGESELDKLICQLAEEAPELYLHMAEIREQESEDWTRDAKEILAPDREKLYSIRISGVGRFLLVIKDAEDHITTTALRTSEKNSYTYQDLREAWEHLFAEKTEDMNWQQVWEHTYHKDFPGKAQIAPVQQPGKPIKTEEKPTPRKESKVQKARKPEPVKKEQKKADPIQENRVQESVGEDPEVKELEKPENTECGCDFVPGMRARSKKTGRMGVIVGKKQNMDAWDILYDGYSVNMCIFDSEVKDFEPVDWEDKQEKEQKTVEEHTVEDQQEEPLPGQITVREIIGDDKDQEEQKEPAGQQDADRMGGDTELDEEWEKEKRYLEADLKALSEEGTKLTFMPVNVIRMIHKQLIDLAASLEKELLRRGEEI